MRPKNTTAVIPFPLPNVGNGSDADPRWERVEALYRELDALDGSRPDQRYERRLSQRIEQMFCHHAIPALVETLDANARAYWMTLADRMDNCSSGIRRREALARVAAGKPRPYSEDFAAATRPTESEALEDLMLKLQREVDDKRRNLHRQSKGGAR